MNELQLISHHAAGEISIDNFQALRDALFAALTHYRGIVYTEEMLPQAKVDKKELSRLRRELEDRRKEVKRAYMAPYIDFESQVKELVAMVDAPLEEVKTFISGVEDEAKQAKRTEIERYFFQHSTALDAMASQVWNSPAFFDQKWLNKTTSTKTWQKAVDEKIAMVARDLQNIQATAGNHLSALTVRYLNSLSTEGLVEYHASLSSAAQAESVQIKTVIQDNRSGSRTIRLSGNIELLNQAIEMLSLLDLDCEILEDDTPQPMLELTKPDFDSFVAFDLETSGTNGAANGDGPAEITEIGAVRVENGSIVQRFSMLVNPGRKILPRISRITGITDAMVAGEPGVDEAIRRFAEFVGDSILVGHNIKGADLHYIDRAAQRAGVRMDNSFFDTYPFVRKLKDSQGWESVKLEYLAEQLGVEQSDAHRAWCDAEATAGIYFKLRRLLF